MTLLATNSDINITTPQYSITKLKQIFGFPKTHFPAAAVARADDKETFAGCGKIRRFSLAPTLTCDPGIGVGGGIEKFLLLIPFFGGLLCSSLVVGVCEFGPPFFPGVLVVVIVGR